MSDTRSDGELLRAVAVDVDRRAFGELYRRYAPWLRARLRGRCADPGVVDDVVQETFLAVWRGTARHRQEGHSPDAAGWLWRIASRRLVDALRGDGARGRLLTATGLALMPRLGPVLAPSLVGGAWAGLLLTADVLRAGADVPLAPFTVAGQGVAAAVAALAAGLLFLLRDRFDLFQGRAV
ncbi:MULTISPECIES: RNA polymerase sigma factor [Streptomyces]|uniref:RNA polymerase sigma factor n=1 Tax=Streptomyces TaxID=1883 RepID=UPI001F102AB3|nr:MULTISPECIES: RNA polymerase sigma factor [Streptomyces]